MKKVMCYFHNDDMDGWASAAIVLKKHPNAKFIGYNYEKTVPHIGIIVGYDIVYMVDCSCSLDDMKFLKENNKKFVWIDHHAKKVWEVIKELDIDGLRDTGNNHSACVLTWKYLYPNRKIPSILKHIEDMDIWKWKLKYTDEINLALFIDYKGNLDKISTLLRESKSRHTNLIKSGTYYKKVRENQVNFLVSNTTKSKMFGYNCGIVNSPIHTSFVGHSILDTYKDVDIAVIWYERDSNIVVSLRSRDAINVADIAGLYGGGGHKNASGFRIHNVDVKHILGGII